MFTGLIEEIGLIQRISRSAEGAELVVGAEKVIPGMKVGNSIAVSGPCLTVTAVGKNNFKAWAMPETLAKTTLSSMSGGEAVNLERALALGDRLGGHLVSGHIDAVVELAEITPQGGALIISFNAPRELLRYIVPKGSVALDGISLTVIASGEDYFSVGLIPHSAAQTTLGMAVRGSTVNLEVDMIAKYVEKMLAPRLEGDSKSSEKITINLLQEKGYL